MKPLHAWIVAEIWTLVFTIPLFPGIAACVQNPEKRLLLAVYAVLWSAPLILLCFTVKKDAP